MSAGEDDTVRFWDADTGDLLHIITAHTAEVYSLAFTPDGSVLTSGAWDASTGHSDVVVSVTFSADGSILATRSWDKFYCELNVFVKMLD